MVRGLAEYPRTRKQGGGQREQAAGEVRTDYGRVDTRKVVEQSMKNAQAIGTERDGKLFIKNRYTGREQRSETVDGIEVYNVTHAVSGRQKMVARRARSSRELTLSRLPLAI